MKFKCGLTDEEKKAKREVELHKAKCLIEHGEVVFLWWPKKIKPGDCRWLEKVKRFPTEYYEYDLFGMYLHVKLIPKHVADYPIKWRYEALDTKG